ncbi:RadC family protein [Gallaecimonas pentaromativorans]|uniref:RadC family protein n=1 Tax=Gallaecimonas pentaromativorans TaxID=584787 RepID=UPI003A902B6D
MQNLHQINEPVAIHQVLEQAASILESRIRGSEMFTNPEAVKNFLRFKLAAREREVFGVLLLDSQHRYINFSELFQGTIDAAAVYPREVVKEVLQFNAAAVVLAHNHPSGVAEPSRADIQLTNRLREALELIDVRVLDHIVVGDTCVPFAERGLI